MVLFLREAGGCVGCRWFGLFFVFRVCSAIRLLFGLKLSHVR